MKLPALALAAFAAWAAPPAQAAYFTQEAFATALGPDAGRLVPLPAALSVTITDSRGTRPASEAPFEFARTGSAEGALLGDFGCNSFTIGCAGAYSATYTFAEPISALGGNLLLAYGFGPAPVNSIPYFGIQPPETPAQISAGYDGWWGNTFAPTNTITIDWPAGLRNSDDRAAFVLTDAVALLGTPRFGGGIGPGGGGGSDPGEPALPPPPVAVPEPTSFLLFALALLGLAAGRRRTSNPIGAA